MKKVLISIIAIVMILTVSIAAFAGCDKPNANTDGQQIGKTMPSVDGATAVSADMSAYEMFSTAVQNYYDADFAIMQLWGVVETVVLGIPTTQMVDAAKIRDGKGDATGNNANGATYYADSVSYSRFASLYEKMYITADSVQYKNGKDVKYDASKKSIKFKSWNAIEDYDSVADMAAAKKSNTTLLWGYDLKEDFVVNSVKPEYIAEENVYKVIVEFDPDKSTVEYADTVKQQLTNAGQKLNSLDFTKLKFEVYIWENGLIRNMRNVESYKMKLDLGIGLLNSEVSLDSNIQFSYDKNEAGYDLAAEKKSFDDQSDLTYKKPYNMK